VREVKLHKKPSNVEKVIGSFEEEGWPNCIDSPLKDDPKTLNNTIEQLKSGLDRITFFADGTGERICWRSRD
jgi:hypothetical protein